jgi:hypothetical protein
MGWESRGNNKYYYRKKRVGGHVHSIYKGDATMGQASERADQRKRLKGIEDKIKLCEYMKFDQRINEVNDNLDLIVNSMLLISGYHIHKGAWRKKRE